MSNRLKYKEESILCRRTNGLPFRVTQMNRETQEDGERRKGDVHVKQMAHLEVGKPFLP